MNRKRFRTIVIAIGALLVVTALPVGVLYLGRRIAWFDIDRVEVTGAHLVSARQVIEASGIRRGGSLFDDSDPWEEAIRRHPVIVDARISRRFPSTLEIQIQEKVAVALVAGDVLTLATSNGEILPVDPTTVPEDLPIVAVEADDSTEARYIRRVLAETGRLTELDPQLVSAISEVRLNADEPETMHLHHEAGEILLPLGFPGLRLAELRSVLADLSRSHEAADPAIATLSTSRSKETADSGRPPVIDLRFEGQVVVRHPLPEEIS